MSENQEVDIVPTVVPSTDTRNGLERPVTILEKRAVKIKRIDRDGDSFVMTVLHSNKEREKWYYERVELGGTVSYIQIGKEVL